MSNEDETEGLAIGNCKLFIECTILVSSLGVEKAKAINMRISHAPRRFGIYMYSKKRIINATVTPQV